jgi:hypothetical protein
MSRLSSDFAWLIRAVTATIRDVNTTAHAAPRTFVMVRALV